MSEQPKINDDRWAEKLARFTPNPAALDRDLLLFEAGRASVRRTAAWPVVVGLLAAAQSLTLYLYLTRPPATQTPLAVQPGPIETRPTEEGALAVYVDDPRLTSYRQAMRTGEVPDAPATVSNEELTVPEPVWTVGSFATPGL